MEAIIGAAVGVAGVLLLMWAEHDRDRRERREDAGLAESIEHLPPDVQHRIWSAHFRLRAEGDL